jgi:hypothetical protein
MPETIKNIIVWLPSWLVMASLVSAFLMMFTAPFTSYSEEQMKVLKLSLGFAYMPVIFFIGASLVHAAAHWIALFKELQGS